MGLIFLVVYTGNFATLLSDEITETSLSDYTDIDGKEIGTFIEYESMLRNFGAEISTFNHDEIDEAIDMLKDSELDGIAIDGAIAHHKAV